MNLSAVIDKFFCRAIQPSVLDQVLDYGVFLTGTFHDLCDRAKIPDYAEEQQLLIKRLGPGVLPTSPGGKQGMDLGALGILNDLYTAKVTKDSDGVLRVQLPMFGPVLSTWSVEHDWRLLCVAYVSLLYADVTDFEGETVILEAHWGDRTVMGYVRPSLWRTISNSLRWALRRERPLSAGLACERCTVRGTCRSYDDLMELPAEEQIQGLRGAEAAQKLMLALMLARASEKSASGRRRTLGARLASLASNEKIDINSLFTIPVVAGELEKYPYAQTRALLEPLGLWRTEFGRIDLRALKAAIPGFPEEVVKRLADFKVVETKEPDIKEVVDGVAFSIQAPLLRGVHL